MSETTLENRLAAMSPDKIKALVQKMNKASGAENGLPKIARTPGKRYPLSSAQERLWFLSQLSPDSRAANNPGALRARTTSPLDRELFQRSLDEVGRRHEILRTTFHTEGGRPVQIVHEKLPLVFGWQDISHLPGDEREREAEKIAVAEGRQEFDLTTGPLITMKILRLAELDYMLLITSHHIVSDGWSMAMFATEVASIYNALEKGEPHNFPEPEIQYLDYVFWEREWTEKGKAESHLNYWKDVLYDPPSPLELPADRPRPRIKSDAGSIEKLTISAGQADALREFARTEGTSLFQVLIAAFNALLYRYTGQEDLIIGTSVANRNKRQFQNVMGLFINTLPIRTRIDGNGPFRDYLQNVQAVCGEALLHQELPFEKLIEELNPQRNLNAHPLFQVMFVHQNVPSLYVVPGMELELFKVDYQTSKFDLTLWVEEINNEFLLTLYYSTDLFESATAKRMLAHYQTMLESAAADAGCAVKNLSYFSSQELEFARAEDGRDSAAEESPAANRSFHRRFEEQVSKHPDNIAVECGGEKLTYRELNASANRLARHLQKVGVGSNSIVALLTGRSTRMLAAMLGIMKAGAAYLPLDETHPPGRWETILGDSGAKVLVTEESFRGAIGILPLKAVYLDSDAAEMAQNDESDPATEVSADGAVYVIYTSGTTGAPKGVCIEHRNLTNYCDAVWREMKLSPGDKFATVSSPAADLGNTMIFPPLLNGASVVIIPQDLATDASGLSAYFAQNPVDCMKIVPSHLHALLKSEKAVHILPEKLLVLGGEAAPAGLIETVREKSPVLRILNHYGPTECTIGVLTCEFEENAKALPLGFPLTGNRVYVLDGNRRPVPLGIAGELYIGGAQVARGYLNRPELSAERFVTDPFLPGERLYRTGDKAKFLPGGAVAFLGRVDRQVKIRGFRVELPEIENILSRHAGVESAVVLPPAPEDSRGQLTAYIKAMPGAELSAETLKKYLGNQLPPYMVPGAFVLLENIPLNANGKIDYQALAKCEISAAVDGETENVRKAPRDQTELELLQIWQELLGSEDIGIDDNFFDVGGHSLLGVQLMSRIDEKFGRHLPLASLFEHGTVEQIARSISREETSGQSSPLVCIKPGAPDRNMFFVHPAGGNVLCYYELARSLGNGCTFYGLQATPDGDGAEVSHTSVTEMAKKYLGAVAQVRAGTTPIFGGWSMGALVAFEMARLYVLEHERLPIVVVLDQLAPQVSAVSAVSGGGSQDRDIDDTSRLLAFAGKVSQLIGKDLGVTADALSGENFAEQTAVFLDRFKAAALVPENTSVAGFQGFLELMLMHNRITAEYSPGRYPGKILVFRAAEADATLNLDPALAAAAGISADREPDLGWQKYSSRPVEVIPVPGDHVSMMAAPNVQPLAEKLARQVILERNKNDDKNTLSRSG